MPTPSTGSEALRWALSRWLEHIVDPKRSDESITADRNRAAILNMMQDGGLDWESWVKAYPGDGAYAWCGAFAAAAWKAAGLNHKSRYRSLASTYRLKEWGREHPGRIVSGWTNILPADIVVVGDGDYGSHITLALGLDKQAAYLMTVEGNAHGRFPDGSWGEGVVMNMRPRKEIRAAYRPIDQDFKEG